MNKKIISRSNLFLLELIIVIVFFIFSISIILGVYMKANELSVKSTALNNASAIIQDNAERYKAMPYSSLPNDVQIFYYDKNWQSTDIKNAYFSVTVEPSFEDTAHGVMTVFKQEAKFHTDTENDFIFSMETKKYFTK